MMRIPASLFLALAASPALAHPGHVVTDGGHHHWIAFGALSVAILVAGVAVARLAFRRRARDHG